MAAICVCGPAQGASCIGVKQLEVIRKRIGIAIIQRDYSFLITKSEELKSYSYSVKLEPNNLVSEFV